MKILFVKTKNNHQKFPMESMACGLRKHGIEPVFKSDIDSRVEIADIMFVWAWKPHRPTTHWKRIERAQKSRGNHFIVMERGYIGDRFHWTSLGYDGLNGNADFCNKNITDPSRFNKNFGNLLQAPKQNHTGKVLVIGQCRHDASVAHVNIEDWYRRTIRELNKQHKQVIFRPHPLERQPWKDTSVRYTVDNNKNLEDTLDVVDSVVTFSSNSGVISTLYGIPTISFDKGSMVYDITKHDLSDLNYISPDRQSWASKMAYTQWSLKEMESGEAWEHLKSKIDI